MHRKPRNWPKKLKEEEEASQWSGIPPKKLLNESFTEQLNCIQVLQQITPLHCAREHLPQDIIKILKHLGKVESTPFDKLYYLAQNCTDHYYTKVIQTFIELIKRNTASRQIMLVNSAQSLKYLEAYGQRQAQLFAVLEKYHQVRRSEISIPLLERNYFKECRKFAAGDKSPTDILHSLVRSCQCYLLKTQ